MKQSWFANRDDQWPPPVIQSPDQMVDGSRLAIWCTQTQRALVRTWCQVLPTLRGLEHLWFHTRVPQALFDAACEVPGLKSLNVKWSGIKSVAAIEHATSLQYLVLAEWWPHAEVVELYRRKPGLRDV